MATGLSKLLEQLQLKAGLNRRESFRLKKEMPEGCKPMSDMTEWIVIDCSQLLPLQEQKDIK